MALSNETKDCWYCNEKHNNHLRLGKLIKYCEHCNSYAHENCIIRFHKYTNGEIKCLFGHPCNINIEVQERKYMKCFYNIFLWFYHPFIVITSIANIFIALYWYSLVELFDTPIRRIAIFLPLAILTTIFIGLYLKIHWNGSKFTFGAKIKENIKLWYFGNSAYDIFCLICHVFGNAFVYIIKDEFPRNSNLVTFGIGLVIMLIILIIVLLIVFACYILFKKFCSKCSLSTTRTTVHAV